ncbi:MAG: NmrA family protein [Myxococcaceae bacterium]|nr:NmrA family protein [Myxococcaceae bacterium]
MILVTGTTGTIGQELCRLLFQSGTRFRALCRRDDQVRDLAVRGVSAVRGDFADVDSMRRAMDGCDRLFLLTPAVEEQRTWQTRAIDVALERGIRHITRISAADANLGSGVPWARAQAEVDHYLRAHAHSIRWTVLRPTGFMQNWLEAAQAIARGVLPHVTGEGRVSYVDGRDVAAVAHRVLTEDGHAGATYFLTGPDALSAPDVAAKLAVALELPVTAVRVGEQEMTERLQSAGLSDWRVAGIMAQYALIAGGFAVDVTGEVQRLTGRPPRSLLQFARDTRALFVKSRTEGA